MTLSSKDKKILRGVAQTRKVTLQLGKQGITEGFTNSLKQELAALELVKIQIKNQTLDFQEAIDTLAQATQSEYVGGTGRTAIFYKRNPELDQE